MTTLLKWKAGQATDAGPRRAVNEDRVHCDESSGVFVVADGLGGHAGGERAAEIAVDAIAHSLNPFAGDIERQVQNAVLAANNQIYQTACEDPELNGMACVLTLAVIHESTVTTGHVGDSRLYLIWNGTVRKITPDHSPVGELEDQGELTEEQAMLHPRRNEVFRDVGSRERAEAGDFVEVRSFPLHAGAALLLCSDGLSDALTSTQILDIVETYDGDCDAIALRLVAAANANGGKDNVSVVFVAGPEFTGVHSPAAASARVRHSITRMRRSQGMWRRTAGRLFWIALGMVIGIAIWIAGMKLGVLHL